MYVLMPTTYIYWDNDSYYIGNIMRKDSEIRFNNIKSIIPNERTLKNEIFIPVERIDEVKRQYFQKLEKKYYGSEVKIGYIETTSICPYHCQMCPKYSHEIIRENKLMTTDTFDRILTQLNYQTEVELHLFGDPFCDMSIYDKIKRLNEKGIIPSFSTNLISLEFIDYTKLRQVRIGRLTISCDSEDYEQFSSIRGNISKERLSQCYNEIENLADLSEETHCIESIILQRIKMFNNQRSGMKMKEIAEKCERCHYVEKEYIEFPNEEKTELGQLAEYRGSEKLLLYHVLGKRTPFKCLKVWDRKEQAITSDGYVVPCCLSYNVGSDLGNVKECTLLEIQTGDEYKQFRFNIWNGEKTNIICDNCFQNEQVLSHTKISKKLLNVLQPFCIETW